MRILLLIAVFTSVAKADQSSTFYQTFLKTDEAYRTLVPSAPTTIPGLEEAPTKEEIALNETYLKHPKKCAFVGEDSGYGQEAVPTSRLKILNKSSNDFHKNGQEVLRACHAIQRDHGSRSCSVIEFGGHANGMSIGLGKLFGFRLTGGEWQRFPKDDALFEAIVTCIKDISWRKAPVIFTTCGAAHVGEDYPVEAMRGHMVFYAKKKEAQQFMSDILGRTVISANGPENGQEWGDHSRKGWYVTTPGQKLRGATAQEFQRHLPIPRPEWTPEGKPTHEVGNYDYMRDFERTP